MLEMNRRFLIPVDAVFLNVLNILTGGSRHAPTEMFR